MNPARIQYIPAFALINAEFHSSETSLIRPSCTFGPISPKETVHLNCPDARRYSPTTDNSITDFWFNTGVGHIDNVVVQEFHPRRNQYHKVVTWLSNSNSRQILLQGNTIDIRTFCVASSTSSFYSKFVLIHHSIITKFFWLRYNIYCC